MYDILVQGGHVIDPLHGVDRVCDVAIEEGRIAAVSDGLDSASARQLLDARGLIVSPGLVDLHVHVHWGVSHYGIDADSSCLPNGVTTAVDAGSAGAYTYPSLKRWVMDPAQTELYAFLNIAYTGMIGDQMGELEDGRLIDEELAYRVGRAPEILGIKARMDRVGSLVAAEPLSRALAVAHRLDKPVMVHIGSARRMHVSLDAILERLGPGDIVTHMYHGKDGGLIGPDGRVLASALAARERGVLFDVGHGAGSLNFAVAQAAISQGFWPDTISTDLHTYSLLAPVCDLPTTLTKFVLLGLPLVEALRRATCIPARIIGQAERLGHLGVGADADLALLREERGEFVYRDCDGMIRRGDSHLRAVATFKKGQFVGLGPANALGLLTLPA